MTLNSLNFALNTEKMVKKSKATEYMSQKYAKDFYRGGSRTAATCKMERFVMIVNDFQPLSQSAPSWMLQQS